MRRLSLHLVLGISFATGSAHAESIEVGPDDDVEAAINALQPGDELVLLGGTYTLSDRFGVVIAGTTQEPIVIRAKEGEIPHFHRPDASQNIWDIDSAQHVVLRGIEFSGGSAGLRIVAALDLTIEGCEIHDTGDVALRANDGGTYEGLRILRNHIHHTNDTGEGMYLGCNSDACRVANSLIEGNYVHHTNQPSVEQGDGIELKEGSFGNVIRDNVIHDTNYPCILTYSAVGNGPANVIERNVMWNCGDHGIQSAADAVIRNNIILSANADGIAMQPHQAGTPSNLLVVHNTVLHPSGNGVSLYDITGSVVIANNAVYSQAGSAIAVSSADTTPLTLAGNVGVGGVTGAAGGWVDGSLTADFVNAHYMGGPPVDVFPAPGSALIGAGDAAQAVEDDFNGTPRNGTVDVGAYVYDESGNPGWPIGEGFKEGAASSGAGGGATGSSVATTGAGGSDAVGGAGGFASNDESAGCGCRVAARPQRAEWLLALALLVLVRRLRRGAA